MKFDIKLTLLPILLITSMSVTANNNLYQDLPETLKNIPLSKCVKYSKIFFDAKGDEVGRFNLPQNKINRALRNNKRLYLYSLGIVKNYSFETTNTPGYPYIIKCPI